MASSVTCDYQSHCSRWISRRWLSWRFDSSQMASLSLDGGRSHRDGPLTLMEAWTSLQLEHYCVHKIILCTAENTCISTTVVN